MQYFSLESETLRNYKSILDENPEILIIMLQYLLRYSVLYLQNPVRVDTLNYIIVLISIGEVYGSFHQFQQGDLPEEML